MNLHQCILTHNDCYLTNEWIKPKGVMVHSTGCNNPLLRRYVQPSATDPNYEENLKLLGYNRNQNSWNRPGTNACVHGFIGKLDSGKIASVQTLPWSMRGWHAGNGTTRPSANNTHISFEICEDDLKSASYFRAVYKEAVELTAYLCTMFDLDPLEPEVVICHSEAHDLGMASDHADVMHWFPKFGKDMDTFRQDVKNAMEDEDMTQEKFNEMLAAALTQGKFNEMVDNYLNERAAKPESDWAKPYTKAAIQKGWFVGNEKGEFEWQGFVTREEIATIETRINGVEVETNDGE